MATLNLQTVELVSTLRAAPENGPTNSQDYNDSWTESLADLASLSGFLNDILLPMLNGLSAGIQPLNVSTPNGIEGRYIFSDTSDITQVFYDSLTNEPLSIADSLRVVTGIVNGIQSIVANLNVEVTSLQTQLSSTNQNDIAQALQNFAASLSNITNQTVSNTTAIANSTVILQTNGLVNDTQTLLNIEGGTNVTVSELAGTVKIDVGLPSAKTSAIQFGIDGLGLLPLTGSYGQISIPYACTITGWVITADQSGSAVIDVLKSTYAAFPTTVSIAGSDKPTLTSAQKNMDTVLTGWTTGLLAGDELQINLNSITTCTRLNLTINIIIP